MYRCLECGFQFENPKDLRHLLVHDPYEIYEEYRGCPKCHDAEIEREDRID